MWPDIVSIALNQKENLSEEEQRKDMLYLLEAKRLILDERNGPGSFRGGHLGQHPYIEQCHHYQKG